MKTAWYTSMARRTRWATINGVEWRLKRLPRDDHWNWKAQWWDWSKGQWLPPEGRMFLYLKDAKKFAEDNADDPPDA
jgi:hypothetical protein